MYPIIFKFGPLTIYTYGFFVFLGVLLGYFVSSREAERQGINKNVFSNIFFGVLLSGFIGARIFYILVEFKWFLKNPVSVIFSRSGFVFYGGIIIGLAALYLLLSKYSIKFLKIADILALGVPLSHSMGRIGCFFYGCCYGIPTESFLGVLFPLDSPAGFMGIKVLPIQLISAFFLFFIFCILLFLNKKRKFEGQILLYYLILYGIFRFNIEFFRGDFRGKFLGFSTSQYISIAFIITGIFLFHKWGRTIKK